MGIRSQNNPIAAYLDVFSNTGTDAAGAAPPGSSLGLTATGGVISDYSDGGTIYRAHIFTSTGTLNITAGGDFDSDGIEYLVVGGGGGGGGGNPPSAHGGSGGGAGGLRTNLSGHPLTGGSYSISGSFPAPYVVTVGGGGNGRNSGDEAAGGDGTNSEFYPPSHSTYPAAQLIRGAGGGGGAARAPGALPQEYGRPGLAGGGSGGGSWAPSARPGAVGTPDPNHPETAGHAGGGGHPGTPTEGGGGGGGAGSVGLVGTPGSDGGNGGGGIRVSIGAPSSNPSPIGAAGPGSGAPATGWFAGGGGGGASNTSNTGGSGGGHPTVTGSYAGGGRGGAAPPTPAPGADGDAALASTGGGGGGGGRAFNGRNGGSGIVVIRYKIGTTQSTGSSPKGATGGAVTIYSNKVIHAFTSTGTFTAPGPFSETLEYVIIGGGGSGGGTYFRGGGGGAGAVRHGTTPVSGPSATTVQVGAGGQYHQPGPGPSGNGTNSFFGSPITAPGGGMGGGYSSPYAGIAGGSGGGAGGYPGGSNTAAGTDPGPSSGEPYPGNPADTSPANGWGYDGGGRGNTDSQQGGGGGGAGGQGIPSDKTSYPSTYGYGGSGVQLPATFQDPRSTPSGTGGTGPSGPAVGGGLGYQSPGGTNWYVAGGGNGGGYSKPSGVNPSVAVFVPAGGGGRGAINGPGNSPEPEHVYRNFGWPGAVNSGSGGGGASPSYLQQPGQGGSGLVLIAYPST